MEKQAIINYLNNLRPFVNLSGLCKAYNQKNPDNTVDYNNLREVLNGGKNRRLSEEKLVAFFYYLTNDLFENVFRIQSKKLCASSIEQIVYTKTEEMKKEIAEALNDGI